MRTTHWLALCLLACPAAALGRGAPAPPPPIPTTYRFEGDVAVEIIQDRDRDGRPDAWYRYARGHPVRLELDRDFDGTVDWRETWEPKPAAGPPGEHRLEQVDGRWRLVPSGSFGHVDNRALYARRYVSRAERLVAGRWTDTFQDADERLEPADESSPTRRWTVTWRYERGKPVEAVMRHPLSYQRVTWADGLPLRSEYGPAEGKLRSVETYRDGEMVAAELFDEAGKPTYRVAAGPDGNRREALCDGRWTGDFEDVHRGLDGRLQARFVYRDGREVLLEQYNNTDGTLVSRRTRRADGGSVDERADRAGVIYWREQYGPAGWPRTTEKLVDGGWTRDFTEANDIATQVYRGGRLVRREYVTAPKNQDWTRVLVSPEPDHEEWGDGRHTRRWYVYAGYYPSGLRRLVREARDLDGDGKPDVVADHEKLTVEQPPAA